jgi:hypothetical protein
MTRKSRWMAWIIEESARPQATMPWTRGARRPRHHPEALAANG